MKKQMIPLSEHEIHLPDHGIGIEAKVARELTARLGVTKHIITEEALRLLDERNVAIKNFFMAARTRLKAVRKVGEQSKKKQYSDVVKDIEQPEGAFSLETLKALFAPRRKLRPKRKLPKPVTSAPRSVSLIVNVQKAQYLPMRREAGGSLSALRPYIQITFQGRKYFSDEAKGVNPLWNEQFDLPYQIPEGKFTSAALRNSSDLVEINIFDGYPMHMRADRPEVEGQGDEPEPVGKYLGGGRHAGVAGGRARPHRRRADGRLSANPAGVPPHGPGGVVQPQARLRARHGRAREAAGPAGGGQSGPQHHPAVQGGCASQPARLPVLLPGRAPAPGPGARRGGRGGPGAAVPAPDDGGLFGLVGLRHLAVLLSGVPPPPPHRDLAVNRAGKGAGSAW